MATATGKLSRERILDAAGRLVENDGLEGLSMRRLAQELDVWPMSVYRYFQDKDALLDALAGNAVASVGADRGRGSWEKRLRSLLAELRKAIEAQPAGMQQRIAASVAGPEEAVVSDKALALLGEAGLPPAEAGHAWQALLGFTLGVSALDGGGEEAFEYGLGRLLQGIVPGETPD